MQMAGALFDVEQVDAASMVVSGRHHHHIDKMDKYRCYVLVQKKPHVFGVA